MNQSKEGYFFVATGFYDKPSGNRAETEGKALFPHSEVAIRAFVSWDDCCKIMEGADA